MTYFMFFLMVLSLITLMYFSYKPYKNFKKYFKVLTSLLFISICLNGYVSNNNFLYFILILLGLIFSLFGDVFLIFEDGSKSHMGKSFVYGLLSFSVAHVFFILAFIFITYLKPSDILFTAIFSVGFLILLKSIKNFDFKGVFNYVAFYAFIISFMFIKSLSIFFAGYSGPFVFVIITGSLLFVISDLILSFVYFYKGCPKFMGAFNLLIYYVAQGLIALSVSFM